MYIFLINISFECLTVLLRINEYYQYGLFVKNHATIKKKTKMKTNIVVKRKLLSYFKCTPYFVCIYVCKKLSFVKGQIMTHHYGLVFIRFSSFSVLKSNQHFIKHNMLLLMCLDEIISRNNIQITTTPWHLPKHLCFLNNILHRYEYRTTKTAYKRRNLYVF